MDYSVQRNELIEIINHLFWYTVLLHLKREKFYSHDESRFICVNLLLDKYLKADE
jgi:hypothetical protein